jgi:Protein kinase domain
LLDFGVAPESMVGAASGDAVATQVTAAATRVYASPEVLSGDDPEPRDDVFSLACVIYEMLAGSHPYGRRGADNALRAQLHPAPVISLDAARQGALAAALELSRAARPSMEELVRAMRGEAPPNALARHETSTALPVKEPPVVTPPLVTLPVVASSVVAAQRPAPKRSRLTWLGAMAAVLALVLGILIGRLDTEPATVVAQVASSPVIDAPPAGAPPEVSTPAALPPAAAIDAGAPSGKTQGQAGFPPGLVSFDTPTMIVSNRAVVAAIPLRHLNRAKLAVDVTWRIIEGSARSGRDYGGASTGVETFVEGNTFRILYVPIVTNVRATGDRTFTVELTGTSAGATVGTMRRMVVTILGDA